MSSIQKRSYMSAMGVPSPSGGSPTPTPSGGFGGVDDSEEMKQPEQSWGNRLYSWIAPDSAAASEQAALLKKHPQQPRIGQAPGLGGPMTTITGKLPKTDFAGGGGMSVMGSIQDAVQNYQGIQEKALAFDWGVEQFCKEAGFDSDDTKLMMALLTKESMPKRMPKAKPTKPQVTKMTPGRGTTPPVGAGAAREANIARAQELTRGANIERAQRRAKQKVPKTAPTQRAQTPPQSMQAIMGGATQSAPVGLNAVLQQRMTAERARVAQRAQAAKAQEAVTKALQESGYGAAPAAAAGGTTGAQAAISKALKEVGYSGPAGAAAAAPPAAAQQMLDRAGGGTPGATTAATAPAAGRADLGQRVMQRIEGAPGWQKTLASLGLLGAAGYGGHQYATEGSTYGLFDPSWEKQKKREERDHMLAMGQARRSMDRQRINEQLEQMGLPPIGGGSAAAASTRGSAGGQKSKRWDKPEGKALEMTAARMAPYIVANPRDRDPYAWMQKLRIFGEGDVLPYKLSGVAPMHADDRYVTLNHYVQEALKRQGLDPNQSGWYMNQFINNLAEANKRGGYATR